MANLGIAQSGWMDTVAQLEQWTPGPDVYNRANLVPLKPRPAATGPQLFIYHDMYGGYVPDGDLYPQGTHNAESFAFNFWQYVDSFSYFTHHWVAPPPPGWINAAHRNGVPMLGNLTPPAGDSGTFVQPLLTSPEIYVKQLVAIAQYYRFDGWAFNFETNLIGGATGAQQLVAFLQQLTQAIHAAIPGSKIFWYDAVTMEGVLHWQGQLNSSNLAYFEACDGIFIDYRWTIYDPNLQISAKNAGSRARDVFAGIQPFLHHFDSYKLVQTAAAAGVSAGLFASSWTYQQQSDSDPFEQREQKFWIGLPPTYPNLNACIGSVISERAVPGGLPFLTNFGAGIGRMFYIEGSEVSPVEPGIVYWSNMSDQNVLPTYRYWISSGSATAFEASLCYDLAYDSGSSLLIAQGAGARPGDSSVFALFSADLPIPALCTLSVRLAPYQDFPLPSIAIVLADTAGHQIVQTVNTGEIQGWTLFSFDLSAHAGFVVASIQAQCTVPQGATSSTAILMGELKLMDVAASGKQPQAVQGLAAQNSSFTLSGLGAMIGSFDLTWDPPTDDTFAFNIYRVVAASDGSVSYAFLGRAFTNAWRVDGLVFGAASEATLVVQPRNGYGYNQTLQQAATVTVQWASASARR
jgi:mannosyl-glycoprotein endo-beta-N-acetylglucosaminidase